MSNTFRIEAPYPAIASTMLLPSPKIGNNKGLISQVSVVKMMDGSRRSFVKSGGGKFRHQWNFVLSRDKMEEFQDFVKRYRGADFRVTWRDRIIAGTVALNPVELRGDGRAGGWPGGEAYETTLELIEV
jgi:hypothetical protein